MSNQRLRCFECQEPLDPRADTAAVELNPSGGGSVGFHRGHLCTDCESTIAEKMKDTAGGNF